MKPFEDAQVQPTSQKGVVLLQWSFIELPSGSSLPQYSLQMPKTCAEQILRWRDLEQEEAGPSAMRCRQCGAELP